MKRQKIRHFGPKAQVTCDENDYLINLTTAKYLTSVCNLISNSKFSKTFPILHTKSSRSNYIALELILQYLEKRKMHLTINCLKDETLSKFHRKHSDKWLQRELRLKTKMDLFAIVVSDRKNQIISQTVRKPYLNEIQTPKPKHNHILQYNNYHNHAQSERICKTLSNSFDSYLGNMNLMSNEDNPTNFQTSHRRNSNTKPKSTNKSLYSPTLQLSDEYRQQKLSHMNHFAKSLDIVNRNIEKLHNISGDILSFSSSEEPVEPQKTKQNRSKESSISKSNNHKPILTIETPQNRTKNQKKSNKNIETPHYQFAIYDSPHQIQNSYVEKDWDLIAEDSHCSEFDTPIQPSRFTKPRQIPKKTETNKSIKQNKLHQDDSIKSSIANKSPNIYSIKQTNDNLNKHSNEDPIRKVTYGHLTEDNAPNCIENKSNKDKNRMFLSLETGSSSLQSSESFSAVEERIRHKRNKKTKTNASSFIKTNTSDDSSRIDSELYEYESKSGSETNYPKSNFYYFSNNPLSDNSKHSDIDLHEVNQQNLQEINQNGINQMKSEEEEILNEINQMKSEQEELPNEINQMKSEEEELPNEINQMKSEEEEIQNEINQMKSEEEEIQNEINQMKSDDEDKLIELNDNEYSNKDEELSNNDSDISSDNEIENDAKIIKNQQDQHDIDIELEMSFYSQNSQHHETRNVDEIEEDSLRDDDANYHNQTTQIKSDQQNADQINSNAFNKPNNSNQTKIDQTDTNLNDDLNSLNQFPKTQNQHENELSNTSMKSVDINQNDNSYSFEVEILSASNVPKTDLISTADPYCKLLIVNKNDVNHNKTIHTFVTAVDRDTQNPEWNEKFAFSLPLTEKIEQINMIYMIYDSDYLGTDIELGSLSLPLKKFINNKNQVFDNWFSMKYHPQLNIIIKLHVRITASINIHHPQLDESENNNNSLLNETDESFDKISFLDADEEETTSELLNSDLSEI